MTLMELEATAESCWHHCKVLLRTLKYQYRSCSQGHFKFKQYNILLNVWWEADKVNYSIIHFLCWKRRKEILYFHFVSQELHFLIYFLQIICCDFTDSFCLKLSSHQNYQHVLLQLNSQDTENKVSCILRNPERARSMYLLNHSKDTSLDVQIPRLVTIESLPAISSSSACLFCTHSKCEYQQSNIWNPSLCDLHTHLNLTGKWTCKVYLYLSYRGHTLKVADYLEAT